MLNTPEIGIEQLKGVMDILLDTPHPNDPRTSYQDYFKGVGRPLIERFFGQRVTGMFPISDTTQAVEGIKELTEDDVSERIHYKLSPDTGVAQLGDAWVSPC